MSSSFFLKSGSKGAKKRKILPKNNQNTDVVKGNKRKAGTQATPSSTKRRPRKDEEEIPSDDEEYESGIDAAPGTRNLTFSSDEAEEETPQDKRLRLAKQYLEEIERQEAERAEDKQLHDHVAQRLQTEYLDSVGRLRRTIAADIEGYDEENVACLKHKRQHLPICTMTLSTDGKYLFTGAKTQFVIKWNLNSMKLAGYFNVQEHSEEETAKPKKRRPHVIAMCLSSDMKFLALAEGGKNIQIWCPQELKHIKTFKGHRDTVTSLVFRKDTHELYSGSKDRSVKIWSLDEMAYVESLFGHQAAVTGIDALSRERAVTSGSDSSLRIWKIVEESQLIYNGHHGNIELVKFINEENFVSAGDDGSLCLWSALKKKALYTESFAHGRQSNNDANWITALACVVNTDLIASGSCDGYIRLWQSANNSRKLNKILEIPMPGFVNSLVFNSDGTKLYAAVAQEHRLGRWWRIKEAKNKIVIINLLRKSSTVS